MGFYQEITDFDISPVKIETEAALHSFEAATLYNLYKEAEKYYDLNTLPEIKIVPTNAPSDYYFNITAALRAIIFFPKFLRHTKGAAAGKRFVLAPWQLEIIWDVYGWYCKDSGQRRFRQVWIEIARKNGKTDFGAGILIYESIGLAVQSGEFYNIAKDHAQAEILYFRAYNMIKNSPALEAICYRTLKGIWIKATEGVITPLSGNPDGKHGKHTTALTVDEAHEIKSDRLYDVIHKAGVATPNYIEWFFTTAGERNGWGYEKHQYMVKIQDGVLELDDDIYIKIFTTDPDADASDEEIWKSANPQLDLSVERRFLRAEYKLTIGNPRLLSYFWMYHLNVWMDGATKWLDLAMWDKCTANKKDGTLWQDLEFDLLGRECFGGLDLASTSDTCALVWVFPPKDKSDYSAQWHVITRFWMPSDNVNPRIEQANVPYARLVRAGAMKTTPGNITDYSAIKRQILIDMKNFNVQRLGVDRFDSSQMILDLMDSLGEDQYGEDIVQQFGQGFISMSSPSHTLERLVLGGMLEHGGNPALRWQAGNVRVKMDEVENIKPTKGASIEKIDGIVSLIMAIGMAQYQEPDALPDTYINHRDEGMVILNG